MPAKADKKTAPETGGRTRKFHGNKQTEEVKKEEVVVSGLQNASFAPAVERKRLVCEPRLRTAPIKIKKKRLNKICGMLGYSLFKDYIDLEADVAKTGAVAVDEINEIFKNCQSREKLAATAQGRKAKRWALEAEYDVDDAEMLMMQLDPKNTGTCDMQKFLNKLAKNYTPQGAGGPTEKELEEAEQQKIYDEMDWTDIKQVEALWPEYVRETIRHKTERTKGITKTVRIEDFCLIKPLSTEKLISYEDLILEQNQKYCLLGETGVGKSCLFKALASGKIKNFPTHLNVHHCEEIEVSPDAGSLVDTVVQAHTFRNALIACEKELKKRLEAKEAPTGETLTKLKENMDTVQLRLTSIGAQRAYDEAAKCLRVLGFDDVAQQKSTNSLSGGLRMRVALAAAFFTEADILLLDEPTNHLDFPSLLWLENKLRAYRKTIVLVCHDRDILENVCTAVINLADKGLKYYKMGFKQYEIKKDKDDKEYAKKVDVFLGRNRNIDFSSPLAAEKRKKEEWRDNYQAKLVMRAGQFTFPKPKPLKAPADHKEGEPISIINLQNVRFSYDERTLPFIFDKPISLNVTTHTRCGVQGPNGAGKSTLLKLLTGRLIPVSGTVTTNQDAKIAYFGQHSSAEMDLEKTPQEYMVEMFPEVKKTGLLRNHLAKVGLNGGKADTVMVMLSHGLRSCVLFAKITYYCPHLLIMDEPTNFLDIETVDALISASNKFTGGLLLVSHSRLFLNKCATSYLSVVPGAFNVYETLKDCERATYSFIQQMESGEKVKIGAGAMAKHGANAGKAGASSAAKSTADAGIKLI